MVTLILLFARAAPMLMNVQQNTFVLLHALPAAYEVEALLAETEQAAEPPPSTLQAPLALQRELKLEGVTVAWPERDMPALDRISLTIPARTTLAVIGPSGAGKSTLADIVMGLLAPDAGQVLVDGEPVTGATRARWRSTIAYVPQDVFLFNDTVRANLAWGLPDSLGVGDSEPAMCAALERAGADFVLALPQGLDTPVGDGGVRLSGGERQRIALARALLRKPTLLILDEATSALDPDNETRIREAIARLHGDLTVIVIGHRQSMVAQADQVIRLEQGRIAAQGTWEAVLGRPGAEPVQ
jgi:ATP-binding cassette subfamily C protein